MIIEKSKKNDSNFHTPGPSVTRPRMEVSMVASIMNAINCLLVNAKVIKFFLCFFIKLVILFFIESLLTRLLYQIIVIINMFFCFFMYRYDYFTRFFIIKLLQIDHFFDIIYLCECSCSTMVSMQPCQGWDGSSILLSCSIEINTRTLEIAGEFLFNISHILMFASKYIGI